VDLLGIALFAGHARDVMEDQLNNGRRPVGRRSAGAARPSVEASQEAPVRLQFHLRQQGGDAKSETETIAAEVVEKKEEERTVQPRLLTKSA